MAKAKKMPDLGKYSKEDLIWIINRMSAFGDDWSLKEAIRNLEYDKDIRRIKEAELLSEKAYKLRQEYIDLLKPYDGKPWSEIPIDILNKAETAIKKAQEFDAKYCRLMGIKMR